MTDGRMTPAERGRVGVERTLFAARWLLAPIYLGMIIALLMLVVKFFEELVLTLPKLIEMDTSTLIVEVLTLVDISLAANLLLIVMLAGYENFVSVLRTEDGGYRPRWLSHMDYGSLKLKLISSICAIASVKLLEIFLDAQQLDRRDALLHVGILLAFALVAVLLALMDRIATVSPPEHFPSQSARE